MRTLPAVLVVALQLSLCGCATVIRGTTDKVRIESEPSGARVELSDGKTGVTPITFELPRNRETYVTCTHDGYEPASIWITPLQSKAGAIAFGGNALIGGAIGGAIDGSTGAAMDLYPNPVLFRLRQARAASAPIEWAKLSLGIARKDVRFVLGDPQTISDETGDQVWTYADGGTVRFHNYFVVAFSGPTQSPTEGPKQPLEPASSPVTDSAGAPPPVVAHQ